MLRCIAQHAAAVPRARYAFMNRFSLLHTGRATPEGASLILSKAQVEPAAVFQFPGATTGVAIAPLGYGSPASFIKDTQVISELKAAVLTRGSNLVQMHFTYSEDPENDEKVGQVAESIAINELLTEDDVPREGLVLSAILDGDVLGQESSLSVHDRLSSAVLRSHLRQILRQLDVEVLDLLIVRLPSAIFTLPTNDATAMLHTAVMTLEGAIGDNLLQGYGFALPSTFSPSPDGTSVTDDDIEAFVANAVVPNVMPGCVALQRRTNLVEGHRLASAPLVPPHVQWIGEFPLDIHVQVDGCRKPLRLKTTDEAHDGAEVAAKLKESFGFALNVETKYHNDLYPSHTALLPPPDDVAWAHILAAQHAQLNNLAEWIYIRETQIQPRLEAVLQRLQAVDVSKDFAFAYSVAMRTLLRHFDVSIEMTAAHHNERILASVLDGGGVPASHESRQTIEAIALRVAQSCQAVNVVLVSQEVPASWMAPSDKVPTIALDAIRSSQVRWDNLD
ncbi:hypothetical protein DYB32_000149 [Aphanomyces invadans]|uniref:NADP-dependent oxidoreductase domain-containing protein n=1 Tax=Aphanomyces invadans TaxID=157072 RepID=A0A418BAY5_9STRA|nr:hypothetical protein DYB32_000149 [Aphanomyces invadans]